jgi:phage gp36-like protein
MYVTPAQLSTGPNAADEIAQLFDLPPELWRLTLEGGDRSEYSVDEIAAADATLESVTAICARATGEVDAYLSQRGYLVPMDPLQFPVLVTWSRAIARYHLHPDRERTGEELGRIERDYRDARRALQLVADAKLSLGAGDPLAPGSSQPGETDSGPIRYTGKPRMFSRDSLRGL